MEMYPTAGELDVDYILSLEQKYTKALSRDQARKFAALLLQRRDAFLDEMQEELSLECPLPLDSPDDDVWDKISRCVDDDTHLALLPYGNRPDGARVDPDFPALAVFLPALGKKYVASETDDLKSEHQLIFDNFPTKA